MKLLEIPEQTPIEDVDEEIIEIFVEEVTEVIGEIAKNFTLWKENHSNNEALKELRRAFHTLKGSGRLVGAIVIGELGWKFESILNRILENTIPITDMVFDLIEQVESLVPGMIEDFQSGRATPYKVALLISQADYFNQTKGESIGEFETEEEANLSTSAPKSKTPNESISKPAPVVGKIPAKIEENDEEDSESLEFSDNELEFDEPISDDLNGLDFTALDAELSTDDLPELNEELADNQLEESFNFDELEQDSAETEFPLSESIGMDDLSSMEEEDAIDPKLLEIFKIEAQVHLSNLKQFLAQFDPTIAKPISQELIRAFHTLNGSSRSVHLFAISNLAGPMENYARTLLEHEITLDTTILAYFQEASELIEQILSAGTVDLERQRTLLEQIKAAQSVLETIEVKESQSEEEYNTKSSSEDNILDASDEFMAIFLDEAEEILENTQSLLERWQSSPNNMQLMKELQRELHTLKGGARMVGIKPMGDLSHHLESILTRIVEGTAQSDPRLQEIVQNSVDELAAMLEAVRSSVPLEPPNDLINQINNYLTSGAEQTDRSDGNAPVESVLPTETVAIEAASKKPKAPDDETESKPERAERDMEMAETGEDRIRVRITLIDKLTNLAGELSISRAHMEQQQGSLRGNISEMEQTVIRLRDQLRRLEIETEAQILSHFGETLNAEGEEEFDPLELDRFSVMQQLSRSLMESVSDLTSIQDQLKTLMRQSDTLLIQQTRIGAELQEGIMRTRMIPFSRITPRLQRIARLTSRELRKQVDFVINGESIEFERTVLNRIVAPLEHLLRNAIGHGIEDSETRQQTNKPALAKIIIDLSKEGSDLIIKLSDDGAGLNLSAIRKKAEERQMLKPGVVINDQELMQFILEPAFSTATTVTQISGRGVGMDVVNNEVKQLGGSLQIYSQTGKGTSFEIRLPLSLTITQALMIHIGEETMAVPLNHVDAVMRTQRQAVLGDDPRQMQDERYYTYMDKKYRVFHLADLLGFSKASIDMPLIPTLLIRTGERRIALLVDSIEGSKEIVVKAVGPQIGAIRWIAGATILGDGRVVLILDVPTLTRVDTAIHYEQSQLEEVAEEKPVVTTIMVVDDSITVRKVTARLLKRQGMEVLTAKDGVDAVAQLQEHIPDLMLLDVEMPRMDGYELATQVRNTANLKHIPIIMITSRTGTKHRDRAEKIGINRYLGKPFNETELLENINALLAERKIQ